MKPSSLLLRRALTPVFTLCAVSAAHAQFVTGFETSSGYSASGVVNNVDDSGLAGTTKWTSLNTGASTTGDKPATGSLALHFNVATTGTAQGNALDLSAAGVDFSQEVRLKFDLAVTSFSAGTGYQFILALGTNTWGANSKAWTGVIFDNGLLRLNRDSTSSPGAANLQSNVGNYTTYSPLGSYITFDVRFNPVTHAYTHFSITGTTSSVDLTSTFAGVALPWLGNTVGDPAKTISLVVGSNDTGIFDVDNLSLTNVAAVPEPSTWSAICGLAALGWTAAGRRRRIAR